METDKFGFKVFVKDGPCTRHGILSIVIPYMILWEWQLLSFFHKNLSYRNCAEKAYDWRMKSQISTWPVGERGSMIYWTYSKLPLKDVLSLSSLQITLHATFCTDSRTVIRYIANESFSHLCCQPYCRKRKISLKVHNDSKSNPADEASPGVTANPSIRNGPWVNWTKKNGFASNLLSAIMMQICENWGTNLSKGTPV